MHRAYVCTSAAIDAGCRLVRICLFFGEEQETACCLGNNRFRACKRCSRHGASCNQLDGILFSSACVGEHREGRADRAEKIFRLCDCSAGDGDNTFNERFALFHGFTDSICRCHILHDDAHMCGKFSKRNLAPRAAVDKLFFGAHRILLFERDNVKIGLFKQCKRRRFVLLDGNEDTADFQCFCKIFCSAHNLGAFLLHERIVAGQVRFAFGSVQDECVDCNRRMKFYMRRETSPAHANDSTFLNARNNLFGSGVLECGQKSLLLRFGCRYNNKISLSAAPVGASSDLFYGSRNTCMNV